MREQKIVLSIAGSDSIGGAGIQADLKTFHAMGVYGTAVISCLTAQNSKAVLDIHAVPDEFVKAQLDAVFDDVHPAAAKTGMLHSADIVRIVGQMMASHPIPVVVDPVMVATSGDALIEDEALGAYKECIFPHAMLVTPNIPEAERITGRVIDSREEMQEAALEMIGYGMRAVLIKGGHKIGSRASDLLYSNGEFQWLESDYVDLQGQEVHGSGCTLSAAIAAGLAAGESMDKACYEAKRFITEQIKTSFLPGKGSRLMLHRR